jgi:hypothetical protein
VTQGGGKQHALVAAEDLRSGDLLGLYWGKLSTLK